MSKVKNTSIVFASFGLVSAIISGIVVLTGLLSFSKTLSPSRPFSYIIFFISFADLIASIGFSLGYPNDDTDLCSCQSFLILYFTTATWVWASILIYQLKSLILYKKIFISIKLMHVIAWTIPLIPAVLPIITNTANYGIDDNYSGATNCNLKSSIPNSALIW